MASPLLDLKHDRRAEVGHRPAKKPAGQVRGIAMAKFTITPARLKVVDFTDPTSINNSEIVVTGPGAPPIRQMIFPARK